MAAVKKTVKKKAKKSKKAAKPIGPVLKTVNFKVKKSRVAKIKAKAIRYTRGNVSALINRAIDSYPNKARSHKGEYLRPFTKK